MIEWEETGSGVRAFDRTKTGVTVRAPDWETGAGAEAINRPIDESVSGRASKLSLPPSLVSVTEVETGARYEHGNDTEPLELSDGQYLANIHGNIKTYLRFSGPATIRKTDDFGSLIIDFPRKIPVTLGFRSHHKIPVDTITVPPTTEGVATAISYASSSHKTTGPDRSYPTLRGHPPRFEVGTELNIPEPVRRQKKNSGIEMWVPDDLETLFVTAPLAYYLQADVHVEERDAPLLVVPEANFTYDFNPLPSYQTEVAAMLRRVFFLDCLVRNAGPHSWDLAELSLLDNLDIDPETTYDATPGQQFVEYDLLDFERIDEKLPEWHLSMYVEPTVDNVSALPYLLSNLSAIYLPESTALEQNELLDVSLGDFYRDDPQAPVSQELAERDSSRATENVSSIERVKPVLQKGQVHGWLAEGVPIDVFKADLSAYENRSKYFDRSSGDISVTLILNDELMGDEHEDVAEIYLERSEDLPIDVTVRQHLSRSELAETLEQPCDFIHYIGHCEDSGLRCTDGHLSVSSIDESNAQTFFLNACGSYQQGMELVKKGSVAGAVTFNKVLNKQAGKVGVSFAQLVINGFSIQRALQLARRRIMMNKDYAVVGDGTHQLTQCDNTFPTVGNLTAVCDSEFELSFRLMMEQYPGSNFQPYIKDVNKLYLSGSVPTFRLDRSELTSLLTRAKMPIIYNGELYWSTELESLL